MKTSNLITLIILVINIHCSHAVENLITPSAHAIISQWFSIDSQHDIKMQKSLLSEDAAGKKFQLSFFSDDQQAVNGILVMPSTQKGQLKLALLLHAMGTDQNIWWTQNKISGNKISEKLLQKGYAVLTLDARRHGKRSSHDFTAKDMISKARSNQPRLYTDMIIGTVRDYRIALSWAQQELNLTDTSILVAGYSMGAQMSLLLASYESEINQVVVMV
ncbi:MAG: alpha/beta fold hydrolase, partial [Alcanivoracaceae bacterium]|nr:alpha/beta fold hydrolase [Alcanivoracaceae bacterium]